MPFLSPPSSWHQQQCLDSGVSHGTVLLLMPRGCCHPWVPCWVPAGVLRWLADVPHVPYEVTQCPQLAQSSSNGFVDRKIKVFLSAFWTKTQDQSIFDDANFVRASEKMCVLLHEFLNFGCSETAIFFIASPHLWIHKSKLPCGKAQCIIHQIIQLWIKITSVMAFHPRPRPSGWAWRWLPSVTHFANLAMISILGLLLKTLPLLQHLWIWERDPIDPL